MQEVLGFIPNTATNTLSPTTHPFSSVSVQVKMSLCLTRHYAINTYFCLIKHYAMKTYWDVELYLHTFLTSAVDGGEWSASRPGHFIPRGKNPRYPLDRMLGGSQSPSGRNGGREKIPSLPLPGIEPRSSSP
jgi:hypothetical protein